MARPTFATSTKEACYEDNSELFKQIRDCFGLLKNYMHWEKLPSFIHTKEYL